MKPIRSGDPLLASTFNEIKQALGGDYVRYGTGLGGGINRAGYPAFNAGTGESGWIYALLSGSFSPYSWQEKHLDNTGAWVNGPHSGTSNAFEVNNQAGLNGFITRIRPGATVNDWRFQFNRVSTCQPVCVTVIDNCGPHRSDVIYVPLCDAWYNADFVITDDNGAHHRSGSQGWASSTLATDLLTFASSNIFDPVLDCVTYTSGLGAYGYYWKFNVDGSVTMTLRVYAAICPPGTAITTAMWADAIGGPTVYIVEFDDTATPSCAYSASFSFDFPATRWSGGSGNPPHGNVTLPVGGATLTSSVVATDRVSGATVTATSQGGDTVTCTTNNSGTCCLSLDSGLWWVQVSKSGCQQPACQLVVQEVNQCPPVCEETVTCSACGGVELKILHGTVVEGTHTYPLTYDRRGWWQTAYHYFTDKTFQAGSDSHTCSQTSEGVLYFYRFYCNGDSIVGEVWTYPLMTCPWDATIAGYFTYDYDWAATPNLVNTFHSTVTPTCDGTNLLATFTYDGLHAIPPTGGNPLLNGDFETADFASWTLTYADLDLVGIQNGDFLTVNPAHINDGTGSAITTASGRYNVYLGNKTIGSLSQTFATVPGQHYALGFHLYYPGMIGSFAITWNGTTIFDQSNAVVSDSGSWHYFKDSVDDTGTMGVTTELLDVVATGSDTLEILTDAVDDFYYLDGLTLIPFPVSTTVSLDLLIGPEYHYLCCGPCPIPRTNLSYSWSTAYGGSGSGTLTYTSPGRWTASGGSIFFSCGNVIFLGVQLPQIADNYTCDPFFLEWHYQGVDYRIFA